MKLRPVFFFAMILASSTAACSGADGDDTAGSTEESENEAALSARAKRIAGSYTGHDFSARPPRFRSLNLRPDGSFAAEIDTGIRCVRAPCPSGVSLYGTFTAGAKYLTLKKFDAADASEYYGRYSYSVSSDGNLSLSRSGTLWNGWSNTLERAASILPDDATKIVASSPGGGFTPPPPPGSNCGYGKHKYTLTIETREIEFETCEPDNGVLKLKTGSKTASAREVEAILTAVRAASVVTEAPCGADKPFLTVSITSPAGTKKYADSFYACRNDGQTYIDGINEIFSAMSDAAK